MLSLSNIEENSHNSRKHGLKQIAKPARSIAEFDFITSVAVDENGV
jgi:hypothetical protein